MIQTGREVYVSGEVSLGGRLRVNAIGTLTQSAGRHALVRFCLYDHLRRRAGYEEVLVRSYHLHELESAENTRVALARPGEVAPEVFRPRRRRRRR